MLLDIKKISTLVLFALSSLSALSQSFTQPKFDNIDADKFNCKKIGRVLHSSKGKLWLTTNKGLAEYNGFTTQFYPANKNNPNSPLSNNFIAIMEDFEQNIWFSYSDVFGFSSFNTETGKFTHFQHDNKIKSSFPNEAAVTDIIEDSNKNLWLCTWNGGLIKMNKEKTAFEAFSRKNKNIKGTHSDTIFSVIDMGDNKLMLLYFDEVNHVKPDILDTKTMRATPFPIEEYKGNLSEEAFYQIKYMTSICRFGYKDKYNRIWIGTYSGLIYFDLKNKTCKRISGSIFDENKGINLEDTYSYTLDEDDRLWVSTSNFGILIVDLKTTHAFYHLPVAGCKNCISETRIIGFTKDEFGNIYVSNGGSNINVYAPYKSKFKEKTWAELNATFFNASGDILPFRQLFPIRSKKLYISSASGIGVLNYENDSVEKKLLLAPVNFKNKEQPKITKFKYYNNAFYYTSIDKLGGYTIATYYNLKTKEYKKATNKAVIFPLFSNDSTNINTYYITYDYRSLFNYNLKTNLVDSFYSFNKEFAPLSYTSEYLNNGKWLFFTSQGTTLGSLVVFDSSSKKTTVYSHKKYADVKINDSMIFNIYNNKKGTVWLATNNGISEFNEKMGKVTQKNEEFHLEKTPVFSVAEDKIGNLWYTTEKGLYRLDLNTKKTILFNKKSGLTDINFFHNGAYPQSVSDNNFLFFPNRKGLLYFDASSINFPQLSSKLKLSNIKIADSLYSEIETKKLLHSDLIFPYFNNNLAFHFINGQTYSPQASVFSYRLLGLNGKWEINENANKISFQNLPPGTYTLCVKCVNGYSVESDEYNLVFQIKKPFWWQWWFILLAIILVGFLLYIIIKQREKALLKKQVELENTINERTKEVTEKASEIKKQKELIEEKQKEIVDSIKYAKRIQTALLASKTLLNKFLPEYFIYFNPKDIVSGDFYWAAAVDNRFYFIVADSTGHGVPGAFMSLLNIGFLSEAINEKKITHPNEILNHVRAQLVQSLSEDGSQDGGQDGMDCSLICFDFKNNKMEYSCAYNPLLLYKNNELIELESDRIPVGNSPKGNVPFTNYELELKKGDIIYIITDGFADQFGGKSGKKLKHKNLKHYINSIATLPLKEQSKKLESEFVIWKGIHEQVDDVCVVAIKI